MDLVLGYEDEMDTSADNDTSTTRQTGQSCENSLSIGKSLRANSLFFATFPWSTALPLVRTTLVEQLGDHADSHYAFVSRLFNQFYEENS
jgi:hypothetical protein